MKICLAIGIGRPQGLDPLRGAYAAAQGIGEWGRLNGYRTVTLTDETGPVTVADLCAALLPLLKDTSEELDRVVVSFAGHGVIRDVGEEYWLLSHWNDGTSEAIDVERFKRRLRTYQLKQLSIVGDACRSPIGRQELDLRGSPILPLGPLTSPLIQIDTILAAQAGDPGYAVNNDCFLSAVVRHSLWGRFPEAVEDTPAGRVVKTDGLMHSVETNLVALAANYNRNQYPECVGAFRRPQDEVYTYLDKVVAPPLPPLPRPDAGSSLPSTKGLNRGSGAYYEGTSVPDHVAKFASRLRRDAKQGAWMGAAAVVVPDEPVTGIALSSRASIPKRAGHGWTVSQDLDGSPFLAELASGLWVGAAIYRGRACVLSMGPHGTESLLYVSSTPEHDGLSRVQPLAINAIAELSAGSLGPDQALDFATMLRWGKHDDPTLGVLAAYMYARASDLDSVRGLAWWYVHYRQPIPFDVAMLAEVALEDTGTELVAQIPPVQGRKPRTVLEERNASLLEDRPGCVGRVAGTFPWMRQGWRLLDSAEPLLRPMSEYASELRPAPFTTLTASAGQALAERIRKG